MMYIYSFSRFFGYDRVFFVKEDLWFKRGDLLRFQNEYYLVLGEGLSFKENYSHKFNSEVFSPVLEFKSFFSEKSLDFVDFLVYNYYTSYRNVLKLFFEGDMQAMMKKSSLKKGTPEYNEISFDVKKYCVKMWKNVKKWQQLVVFPDLWTMYNILDVSEKEKNLIKLHWASTQAQKIKVFWDIKNGALWTLFCTYSQIFQDWKSLDNIILIDAHKWYYKSQQDPRYYAPSVLRKMAHIYQAWIDIYWYQLYSDLTVENIS